MTKNTRVKELKEMLASETDPDKITEWKDDKNTGSLHEMRSKKIHDKKDDEDEDKD